MLNKRERMKNKSGIFANYQVEYTLEGDEVVRERFFNANSEEHAREMFEAMMRRQNIEAEILSVKKD